jgi:glycosyltransferase involved in cell wall biosynthesis
MRPVSLEPSTRVARFNLHCVEDMRIIILHTVGGVSKDGIIRGGTSHFAALAREWSGMGVDVRFVTNSRDYGAEIYSGVTQLFKIPSFASKAEAVPVSIQILANHFVQRRYLRSLASALADQPESTVIVASSSFASDVLAALFLHRLIDQPAVVYFHHLAPPPWFFPTRRGSLLRITVDWLWSTLALAVCKVAGLAICIDQPRIVTESPWRFGSVLQDQDFLSDPIPAIENKPRDLEACYISPMTESKGVLDLLESWCIILSRLPSAKLVVAGSSPGRKLKRKIDRLLQSRGLRASVELQGYVSVPEKLLLLRRAKLFLFPSYAEGWSLAVMEAASVGTLPLVYDLPAYDYLGRHEIKVPIGDVKQFAEVALRLLEKEDYRSQIAQSLALQVQSFRLHSVAKSQLDTLREISNAVASRKINPIVPNYR